MLSASVRNCSSRSSAGLASAAFSAGEPSCSSIVCIGVGAGRTHQPGRLVWNIESADVKGDFEKLKAAGATVIQEPYHPGDDDSEVWIATFSDPDSNYFQLVSPM